MCIVSAGGRLKKKKNGTIDVVWSIMEVCHFTHSYFISSSLKRDENASRFSNSSQRLNPNSTFQKAFKETIMAGHRFIQLTAAHSLMRVAGCSGMFIPF